MTDDDPVPAALREHHDQIEVDEQLHDVPPNEVFLVTVDGERAVLKRSTDPRGDAGVEGRVQRLVGRETALPVPTVLWVGEDSYLAAFDEGVPDPETAEATPKWCRAAGRGLAELHSLSFDRHGPLAVDGDPADPAAGLRVDAPPDATWPDALDRLLATFRESVAGTEYVDVVDHARSFVQDHADRLSGVEPVLHHGWFTPEHVGVDDSTVRAVVDFEHATVGAAAYDLRRVAVPTFDSPERDERWVAFREAYASVRSLPDRLAERADVYRALVGVSYLDSLATQRGIEGNRDRADRTQEAVEDLLSELRQQW